MPEAIVNHQLLIDKLLEHQQSDGYCYVSQTELAQLMNLSPTWVSTAIRRLNAEDLCVEKIRGGKYKVHYSDIKKQGTFAKLLLLTLEFAIDPYIFFETADKLAERFDVKLKTAQVFWGYLRSGWKDDFKRSEQ